jgi:hypothetical protein
MVDSNKGDDVYWEYRSRLVAKEIRVNKILDLSAATRPLEAVKVLFSLDVTEGVGFVGGRRGFGKKLEFIDVKRA